MKVGTRFIVALLMVLLPVMGAYMYWSVHRSTQSFVHDLARESRATARSLGAALDDDIRSNEWDQVHDVLERIRPDGTEAAVFTKDGRLWYALSGFPERLKLSPEKVKSATAVEPLEFHVEADPDGEWMIRRLRGDLARSYGIENIIAADPQMKAVLRKLEQFVDANATVVITGESGTGKDLLARALHFESRRRDAPFVPINCAAIPDNLIESELFGYSRGAFTDARQSKLGLFQAARGGTLFLDEIGEMPLSLQAKLLRVIEDKKVRPLGATEETPVDVRIVAATNSKLEKAIADGKFRPDLFYRLATFTLTVPPLRERRDDIPLLIKPFLVRACAEAGKAIPTIDPDAMDFFMNYCWPGNIRELQSAIQSGVILSRNGRLTVADLPASMTGMAAPTANMLEDAVARKLSLERIEQQYARMILDSVGGNKTEAAAILKIDRKTLYRKLGESVNED